MTEENQRNSRKELIGVVLSKTGDKSIKVGLRIQDPHPLIKRRFAEKRLSMFMTNPMIQVLATK